MKLKSIFLTLLAAILIIGCQDIDKTQEGSSIYPIQTQKELTYWIPFFGNGNYNFIDDINNTDFMEALREQTGVNVRITASSVKKGVSMNDFNLLMASGDLPDIMAHEWYLFSGGPQQAIDDGYIIRLNEAMEEYAPNLREYLGNNPDIDKRIRTYDGSYYVFPCIREDEEMTVSEGPFIRKDWLDDLGLSLPETIDDWYVTLKAFKEEKNADAPFAARASSFRNSAFIGAFGIKQDWFVEDGEVKYGYIDPRYKEFLITMNKWYREGLLDPNFASNQSHIVEYKILSGKAGAAVGHIASSMTKWNDGLKKQSPPGHMVATQYPIKNKGDRVKFTYKDDLYTTTNSVAITTKCEDIELAARFLDFGYSDEGRRLYNYGILGKSYTIQDGEEIYTEEILNNPDGLAIGEALAKYTQVHSGPFLQEKNYLSQVYNAKEGQNEALGLWLDSDVNTYRYPMVAYTREESREMSGRIDAVSAYARDMQIKFIMGQEPIEKFDEYVSHIYELGIEKLIDIQQKALERYGK